MSSWKTIVLSHCHILLKGKIIFEKWSANVDVFFFQKAPKEGSTCFKKIDK